MSDKPKTSRLGKAASEFNISTATIVNFLSKNGHEIKDEPNAKLSEEMYSLLVTEYQKEKDIKEKSSEIEIGRFASDTPSAEEEVSVKKKTEVEEVTPSGEILVKDMRLSRKDESESAERADVVFTTIHKPKVITKINLEEEKPQKKKTSKKSAPAESEQENPLPKEEAVPEVPVSEEKEEIAPVETEIIETPEIEQPKESVPTAEDPQEKTVAPEAGEILSEEKDAKVQEQTPVVTEEKVETEETNVSEDEEEKTKTIKEEKSEETEKSSEIFQFTPSIKLGVKKLGTIDLTGINQSTKPKKKSKEELQREKEQKKQERKDLKKKDAPKKGKKPEDESSDLSNFVPTESPKLAGPKVIATINLPSDKTSGDESAGARKKRKRIKSGGYTDEKSASFGDKDKGGKTKGKEKKSSGKYKVDFTEEDITEQIRRTYSGMAPVKKTQASKHRKEKREHKQQEMLQEMERNEQEKSILKVTEFITANELAIMMNRPVTDIISVCMSLGLAVAINQRLSAETITLLAENYGYTVQFVGLEDEEETVDENPENLVPRAPIITVMGHVDHGKTSLLDYIRNTNVIQGEAGGITQHIGAYEVKVGDKSITFLDTPGHEAFTAMRARGASITDIVIIVIAADDQIMPQTVEAINHAQAAGVPMIFAINKIDKPQADPEKIRGALANMNLLVEEWGGKIQSQEISAKKGTNVDLLLEKVLIEAEMLDLKANPNAEPTGTVIESSLDKGRGYVAKILVQNGTLHTGDILAAGTSYGKIRAMYNEKNQLVKEAGPSVPVLLLGLNSAPQAGDSFKTYKTDKDARSIVNKRSQLLREQGLRTQKHITLDELGRRIAVGDFKELNIIVKGDVDGSIEALSDEILKLSTDDVQVNVIHKSVGQVTESDVLLASASNAIIIAFQVRPSSGAKKLAEQEQVDIRVYSVIYSAIDDLKAAIAGMKAPELKETVVSNLEVRETFHISKVGVIAGCYVMDGKIQRSSKVRVIRDGIVIHDKGKLGSLKRFKDDAKEVTAGLECGLNIESFNDIRIGDQIEAYEEVEVKA